MAMVRDAVRKVVWKTGKIVTAKAEIPEGQGLEYRDYFDYSEPVAQIPPHRVLAINRGDKEGPLKVKLEVSRPDVEAVLFSQLPLDGHPQGDLFRAAAMDAVDRLILPSMEREVRRDLTEAAEKHAVEVFARNLGSLLLQPPIPKQVVLAIDPGFRTGCKVAVLDPSGNLLDQTVIFPHPPQNRRSEAKVALKDLVGKHQVNVVAIGNGTACRETEELIAEIIAEGMRFSQGEGAATDVAPASPADAAAPPSPVEDAGDSWAAPAIDRPSGRQCRSDGHPGGACNRSPQRASVCGRQRSGPFPTATSRLRPLLRSSPQSVRCRPRKTRSATAPQVTLTHGPRLMRRVRPRKRSRCSRRSRVDHWTPTPRRTRPNRAAAPAPESPPVSEAVSTDVLEGAGTGFGDEGAARSHRGVRHGGAGRPATICPSPPRNLRNRPRPDPSRARPRRESRRPSSRSP